MTASVRGSLHGQPMRDRVDRSFDRGSGSPLERRGMSTVKVSLAVNGERHELDVEPRLLLVHLLRDRLGLTGPPVGCDTANRRACTVHLDGEAVKSCTVLAVQADGAEVKTIEGMATSDGTL